MSSGVLTEARPVVANGAATHSDTLSAHYNALVQRIQAANLSAPANQTLETIGVTSCSRGAGVSTVAFNIAVAAARAEMGPVLLVDADIAKQANRHLISGSPTLGLADALADTASPLDCVVKMPIENLSVVAGRGETKYADLSFDPFKAAELFNEYKRHFKLVIVDVPAPSELNSSIYLAGQLDGVVLVLESESSDGRVALRTKEQLLDVGANLLGVVINKQRRHVPNWLYNLL